MGRQPVTLPRCEPRQSVFWFWCGQNESPLVSPAFLARQRQILLPAQYAREHENAWIDGADALVTAAEVDDAMDGTWIETPTGEQVIRDLADSFPPFRVLIESWQGLGAAQSLTRAGLPVEIVTLTLKRNAEEWGLLAQLFAARRVVLPIHPRLREELLGLSYEVGPTGIRVTDRRAVHQDHAVCLRMLAAVLAEPRSPVLVW